MVITHLFSPRNLHNVDEVRERGLIREGAGRRDRPLLVTDQLGSQLSHRHQSSEQRPKLLPATLQCREGLLSVTLLCGWLLAWS